MENDDTWIELSAAMRNVVMWLALIGIADRDRGSSRSEAVAIAAASTAPQTTHTQERTPPRPRR